ncbi:U3 small nucleolar RNA-associated protein 13 [Lithohypha guttulata]|uniref:U3 small nucleolar RNA-associated protein 13 n=1 Tax=Lithohypha guttulata TaxID=1690604 RepID=UPI002DDF1113|nr:U3 small nucleolar RNA-associated protein 13 [Lithohypha guttulata]KAK5099398.1 U3 small nucleolar RNA-associated protein 13 [Lithohypha guttulata]
MASKLSTRTTFKEFRAIEPFYTGGEITTDETGTFLASTLDDEDCLIVDQRSAKPLCRIEGDGEAITSLALTRGAQHVVVCSRSLSMRIFQLAHSDGAVTAELLRTLKPHATPVVASTVDSTGTLLATGGADGIVKIWDIRGGYCSHTFHGHGGVITALEIFDSKSARQDTSAKKRKSGQVNGSSQTNSIFLASSAEDGRIKVHNLGTRQQVAALDSHVSVVRACKFSPDQDLLVSASRDRTIVLWDVKTWTAKRVLTATEEIEAAGFMSGGGYLYAGGEQGRVRLWSTSSGQELQTAPGRGLENESITTILSIPGQYSLLAVRNNQVLELLSYQSLEQRIHDGEAALVSTRTFSGNHDEVIDIACIDASLLAIADNTETVKILSTAADRESNDSPDFGSNVSSLEGHTDVVICMDVDAQGQWFATGSKDNTARIWHREAKQTKFSCFATLAGHTASIGAIGFPKIASKYHIPPFLVTGSEDKTVKKWDLSKLQPKLPTTPHAIAKAVFTRVAHEKDINAIDLSPTEPLFASASQDRTIKIWSTDDGSTTAILKGHKRGVWSVRFSPAGTPALSLSEGGSSGNRGLLVSGSGDNTVKVWSLNTYTCLLTFEGHQNSVLKVLWLPPPSTGDSDDSRQSHQNKPMIASASSDTLIKLWSPYASADADHLLTTLDGHTDRVWSLAAPLSVTNRTPESEKARKAAPYSLISGAADAKIAFWTDTTATTAIETTKALTERVEQDQMLQNHILARHYKEGITLSLALNHPGRLLRIFEDVVNLPETEREPGTYMGVQVVDDVIGGLNQEQLYKLLERIRDWNTNARTATVAQKVLNCLLRKYPQGLWTDMARDREVLKLARSSRAKGTAGGNAMKDLFRALEAYTERHYKRIEELIDESYLLEYTLREMDEIGGTTVTQNGTSSTSKDMIMI